MTHIINAMALLSQILFSAENFYFDLSLISILLYHTQSLMSINTSNPTVATAITFISFVCAIIKLKNYKQYLYKLHRNSIEKTATSTKHIKKGTSIYKKLLQNCEWYGIMLTKVKKEFDFL